MKARVLFYFLFSVIASISLVEAMEPPKEKLEEFQKVIMAAIPNILYSPKEDCNEHEKIVRSAETYKQQGVEICSLQPELYLVIMFALDTRSLLTGLASTCKFFHILTQSPYLQLTGSCLYETVPHNVPNLVLRTKNTKGGLCKLAELYSVTPEHLAKWFDISYLIAHLGLQTLPPSLNDLTDEHLNTLYPYVKIVRAVGKAIDLHGLQGGMNAPIIVIQPDTTAEDKLRQAEAHRQKFQALNIPPDFNCVQFAKSTRPILNSYYQMGMVMTLPIARVVSILPLEDHRSAGLECVKNYLWRNNIKMPAHGYTAFEVLTRELLMTGKRVNWYLHPNLAFLCPIVDWCIENDWEIENIGTYVRIPPYNSDVALKALRKLITLSDLSVNQQFPGYETKLDAFIRYAATTEADIEKAILEFSDRLNGMSWDDLSIRDQQNAIRLFVRLGKHDFVKQHLTGLTERIVQDGVNTGALSYLIEDLLNCECKQEAEKLIQSILKRTNLQNYIPIYHFKKFFGWVIDMDRATAIAALKHIIESPHPYIQMYSDQSQYCALACLAQHAAEQESDYIQQQVQRFLLLNEHTGDSIVELYFNTYLIYHYLGMEDTALGYYVQALDMMIAEHGDDYPKKYTGFKEGGILIDSLSELKKQDPFKVASIYLGWDD